MGTRLSKEDRAFLVELGWRVRMRRQALELSQQELSAMAGMSRNFVSSIERGAHGVDVIRVRRLADALGVDVAVLVSLAAWNKAAERAFPGVRMPAKPEPRELDGPEGSGGSAAAGALSDAGSSSVLVGEVVR